MNKLVIRRFIIIIFACFAPCLGVALAGTVTGVKTSQHESFKPENFERLAVIVKPIQSQGHLGMARGMGRGHQQSQNERLIEQGFMRVLMGHGYTLVSRTDLDAAMQEKGLDDAHMTDEKYSEEAAKLLHVSALMIVSVDDFSVNQSQRQAARTTGTTSVAPGYHMQTVYDVSAALSARLVKIDNNMVMWTGDMALDRTLANPSQENQLLGSMAEAIATSFPAFPPKKE